MGRRGGVLAKNTDKTMKKIFGLGLAALMLALPGCVQDPTNDEGIAGGGTETVTVNVSVESLVNEDGTRITLGGESGNAFVWEAGDISQFFYKASGNVTYTLTEGVDDAIIGQRLDAGAQFTLDIPAGETVKWAIKYTIVDDDVKKAGTSNIKSGKDGSVNPSATKVSYWSSDTIEGLVDRLIFVGKVNADGTCILRNTMGIAEVKFTGNGEKVWGVTLANRDYSLRTNWGYLQTTVDEPMFSSYYRYWNKGYDSQLGFAMYLTSNGVTVNEGDVYKVYFAVPLCYGEQYNPIDCQAGDLAIIPRYRSSVRGGTDAMPVIVSSKPHKFQRNVVTRFAAIDLTKLPVSYTAGDAVDLTTRDGLSNCYMVCPSDSDKHYCISSQMLQDASANGSSCAAFPMWETQDGLIKNIYFDKGSKKIYFTVAGGKGEGSAMLGFGLNNGSYAYDTACYKAWHIWVTNAQDVTYGTPAVTMLDRNLGAMYAPKSADDVAAMTGEQAAQTCGFYYQWGRRVPFPGPKNLDGSLTTATGYEKEGGPYTQGKSFAFVGNTQDHVLYKYTYTTQFFTNVNTGSFTSLDLTYYNMGMGHGYTDATYYTWASDVVDPRGGNANTWAYGKKGANDPCPAGYRVATHDELVQLLSHPVVGNEAYLKYRHYDVDKQKWITDSKYEDNSEACGNVKEYGGYFDQTTVSDNTAIDIASTFVFIPYAGIREGELYPNTELAKTGDKTLGRLRYTGYCEDATYSGKAAIWGVPKSGYTYPNAADFNNTKAGVVSFTETQTQSFAANAYPIAPIVTNSLGGNVSEGTTTISLDSALPVRCVKITSGVSVAPIEGTTTDTNVWN